MKCALWLCLQAALRESKKNLSFPKCSIPKYIRMENYFTNNIWKIMSFYQILSFWHMKNATVFLKGKTFVEKVLLGAYLIYTS